MKFVKNAEGKVIDRFVWGNVLKCHEIGDFVIAEYEENETKEICFHPYVNEHDTHKSYTTLDSAIVGAITYKYEGPNNQYADKYICNMLNIK